jgi:protein-tyrosine phosphatase
MPSILMVCTANQFRSPLAVACLQDVIRRLQPAGLWTIESAGTWTKGGMPVPEIVLQIGKRLGLAGLEKHRSRPVDQYLLTKFDLCLVMEAGHKEALRIEFPTIQNRIHLLSEVTNGFSQDIPDPIVPGINPNLVADEIKNLIEQGASKIFHLAAVLSTEG